MSRTAIPTISAAGLVGLAGITGALILASFPPFGCGWLMWVALVPLFSMHERLRPGVLFFFGYLLALVPVLAIAVAVVPASPVMFALLVTGVPAGFAAAIVLGAWVERQMSEPQRLLVFPSCAVLVESALGSELVGIPATIALTQADYPRLIQHADLFGTAGTTFLLVLVNRCWPAMHALLARERATVVPYGTLGPWIGLAGFMVNLLYGAWALRHYERDDAKITIATVQPNISTGDYENRLLDPAVQQRIDARVASLTERAFVDGPDLVVISEGGNARYNFRVPKLRRALQESARRHGVGFIVSSPDLSPSGDAYNALFSLGPDGSLVGSYRKRLLTPVGEHYLTAGASQRPLVSAVGSVGAMVCFESCFASIAAGYARDGAELLLVSLSDASFRNSALALLHARFSIFRSIETRRYLVQAANSGPSMIVRPTGVVSASTPFLASTTLLGSVGLRDDATLFARTRFGMPVGAALVIGWSVVAALRMGGSGRARGGALASGPPWKLVVAAAGYAATTVALGLASVHLATRDTPQDRGVVRNVAALFAAAPEPDSHAMERRHLQRNANTCGPAALSYLLDLYGLDATEDDVEAAVRLEPRGTTMLDLVHAARTFGFDAWGERLDLVVLAKQRVPVIAHLSGVRHFVVVLGVDAGDVRVFDPGYGYRRYRQAEFARLWDGAVLQVRFPSIPEVDGVAPGTGVQIASNGASVDADAPALAGSDPSMSSPSGTIRSARDSH